MEKVKILFLAANPSRDLQLDHLDLDEEFREIDTAIQLAKYRDALKLIPCLAVRPDDLRRALLRYQPHILHFSGHGSPSDGLFLLDDDSNPHPVSKTDLVDLLRTLQDNLKLVVLNACYSRPQAEAIATVVDCTIGMNKAIGDKAAIKFAATLYGTLGDARSVQTAFDLGLSSLKMDSPRKEKTPDDPQRHLTLPGGGKVHSDGHDQIPQLIVREGVDTSTVYLVKPKLSHEEITRYARQHIAEAATKWLVEECDPFVMPAMARRVTHPEPMMTRHVAEPWESLSEDETNSLILGQLPESENRVRVFSQSGTGKTTLLHYCEQQIAEANDGRVPIRVSALSTYDWTIENEAPRRLANRLLHAFLPADTDEAERIAWLRRLIHDRRVVFLFDAVDQTTGDLSGLSLFLQSADVCHCPAILTGRPEVEQTQASVFEETHWATCRVEPLDEPRIRRYLGELSDKLLPVKHEDWKNRTSYARKQEWSDLLKVPLLLRLMRRLASDDAEGSTQGSLTDLHSRHAVYREAVRHLVDQGWSSLSKTSHRRDLLHHAEVNGQLSNIAWEMVSRNNFTGVFHGESFQEWLTQHRGVVPALEQLDLTTRCSLLDNPDEFGLAWRHLSFCEYFAGKQLARLDRSEQERIVQTHGRNPSWQWVFRFALSELDADDHRDACNALARDLIRFGNPFLVYDAIRGDRLTLSKQLDTLCRWLVHEGDFRYREAWEIRDHHPDVNKDVLSILETLCDRLYRDGRFLCSAWELLTSSSDPSSQEIQTRFLAEFTKVAASSATNQAVAGSLSLDEHFIRCPPAGLEDDAYQIGNDDTRRVVKIKPVYLGKAPVTNSQYELFDPSHKQCRDEYSPDDDSPAVYVNWYMAVMFCIWLGEGYRLPTENEWEVACRAGTRTPFWWGGDFDDDRCNSGESGVWRALPANPGHANSWGFMEMCGNVCEWCQDSTAGFLGGSYRWPATECRCFSHLNFPSTTRYDDVGFRLARTYP